MVILQWEMDRGVRSLKRGTLTLNDNTALDVHLGEELQQRVGHLCGWFCEWSRERKAEKMLRYLGLVDVDGLGKAGREIS